MIAEAVTLVAGVAIGLWLDRVLCKENLGILRKEVKNLKGDDLQIQVNGLESRVDVAEGQLSGLNTSVNVLRTSDMEHDGDIENLQAAIASFRKRLDAMEVLAAKVDPPHKCRCGDSAHTVGIPIESNAETFAGQIEKKEDEE